MNLAIESCDEVIGLLRALYEAIGGADDIAISSRLSRDDGLIVIGTDPRESWLGFAVAGRALSQQAKEFYAAGMRIHPGNAHGYRDGSVAWVDDQPALSLADGSRIEGRVTGVARLEDRNWRWIQLHFSLGVSNAEAIGQEFSV